MNIRYIDDGEKEYISKSQYSYKLQSSSSNKRNSRYKNNYGSNKFDHN